MRLRNIPGADEKVAESPYVVQEPEALKGQWKQFFGNNHPLYVEIGCGKGRFITTLAKLHPEVNYVGIEKFSSVLLRCIEKLEGEEEVPNLKFLRFDAEELLSIFSQGEIDRIYLNFSDPWPKDRHHKRRLTSREYLAKYEEVLADGAVVEFKTDNVGLFDFSLAEQEESGWTLLAETRNLHKDPALNEGNVMTEYEEKFSVLGNKICKLIMKPGQKS